MKFVRICAIVGINEHVLTKVLYSLCIRRESYPLLLLMLQLAYVARPVFLHIPVTE